MVEQQQHQQEENNPEEDIGGDCWDIQGELRVNL